MSWIDDLLEFTLHIFTSLLTPVIAIVVAYIAYRQHKSNQDKVRFDLYDRRLKVFEGLTVLLWGIFRNRTCSDEERDQFQRTTVEGCFLFDRDIADYLDTIHKKTLELGTNLRGVEKGSQTVEKDRQLLDWFAEQFEVSKEKFAKYLSVGQSTSTSERRTMNWRKGFKRIAWVLSIGLLIFWIGRSISFLLDRGFDPDVFEILASGVLRFIVVWVVYCAGLYIIKGFLPNITGQKK